MCSVNKQLIIEIKTQYRNCLRSYKPVVSDYHRNEMNKTIKHFLDSWPELGHEWTIKYQLVHVASNFACRHVYDTFEESQRTDITRIYYCYFEYALAELKLIWYVQNNENSDILDDIRRRGYMSNEVYHALKTRYSVLNLNVGEAITLSKPICKTSFGNYYEFNLRQSANYHCHKHPIQDIYENRIKRDNLMVDPLEYLIEAHETVANKNSKRISGPDKSPNNSRYVLEYSPDEVKKNKYLKHTAIVILLSSTTLLTYYKIIDESPESTT